MPFKKILHDSDGFIKHSEQFDHYFIGMFLAKNKDKSSSNEDALFVYQVQNGLSFGVSDGAGGHPRGKDAAFICADEVGKLDPKDFSMQPLSTFDLVNDKILELKAGARATLSSAVILGDELKCFSVGDSEIVYWNSLGTELYSNIPQSEVGYKIEAGLIDQEESLDDEDRYLVTNLMGDKTIRIEATSKMILKKGHTVIVGSDGLFDNISHEKLKEMIFPGDIQQSFEKLCHYLEDQNPESWKKDDDISFVLVRKVSS